MTSLDEWLRQRDESSRAYEAEQRQEFFDNYDGSRPIPDLEFPPPTCPACSGELEYDIEWWCVACCLGWDTRGERGSFDADDAAEDLDHPRWNPKENIDG